MFNTRVPPLPHSPCPATWKGKLSEDPASLEPDKENLFHDFHVELYEAGQLWVSFGILQVYLPRGPDRGVLGRISPDGRCLNGPCTLDRVRACVAI